MAALLGAVTLCALPIAAHAQDAPEPSVCLEPVRDAAGVGDPEIDRVLHAAVPLIVTPARSWRFASNPDECGTAIRVRFIGHRVPEVRYSVEVELPGQPTESLSVESHAGMGTFAVAEALCVNALLLLGQPIRPSAAPSPALAEHNLRLWLAPSATFGTRVAVFGSELGVRWWLRKPLWLAASVGFEGFGQGSNTLGQYQYSVGQVAIHGGWRWQLGRVGVTAGVGLRERIWLSHLQTQALHEDYDFDLALESEVRASIRVAQLVRLGLAARPSVALDEVVVAAPGEPDLFRVPRFLMQFAVEIAIEL